MALDALWAVLNPGVSQVSEVQAPVYAGFADTPAVLSEVSQVSGTHGGDAGAAVIGGSDTPDTPPENVRYQAEPFIHAGCTLDTPDTCKTIDTEANAVNQPLSGELLTPQTPEPKLLFRPHGPWLTGRQALDAKEYQLHHFNCPNCIAAGRGERYGRRCAVGLALWINYNGEDVS